jgi:hypothetical protein
MSQIGSIQTNGSAEITLRERCAAAVSAAQIHFLCMDRGQLGGSKVRALQRGTLKMDTGQVSPHESGIIEPGPPKVKPSQEPACEHQSSQVRYDAWMLLAPPIPEAWRPPSQRFLQDLQVLFGSIEGRLAS